MRSITPAGAEYVRTRLGPQASASRKKAWREHLAASAKSTCLDQAMYALKTSEKALQMRTSECCARRAWWLCRFRHPRQHCLRAASTWLCGLQS